MSINNIPTTFSGDSMDIDPKYFDALEDLSLEYYKTGSPKPEEIETEIIGDELWQNQKEVD